MLLLDPSDTLELTFALKKAVKQSGLSWLNSLSGLDRTMECRSVQTDFPMALTVVLFDSKERCNTSELWGESS